MPRVADYSILTDNWWAEGAGPDPLTFEVPDNIDPGSRSILGFMMKTQGVDDIHVFIRLNSTQVFEWPVPDDLRVQYFQEVIPRGLVKPGTNTLTVETTSSDFTFLALSDVVLWWQANI